MTASHVFTVRITREEKAALDKSAQHYGMKRSQIVRRFLRELVRGRPDYFGEDQNELRKLNRGLTAIGRNLNQIAKSLNSGKSVQPQELGEELDLTRQELEQVRAFIRNEVQSATRRTVKVLKTPEAS